MHETETHRDHGHPEDDVQRHEDELEVDEAAQELVLVHHLVLLHLDGVSGDHVAEADGGERDEAEVEAVEEEPLLPLAEEDGAAAEVADHDHDAEVDGDGDSVQRLRFVILDVLLLPVLQVFNILVICTHRTF